MTLYQVAAVAAAIALIVGVPAVVIWSMVAYFRMPKEQRRRGGSQTAGIGAAMQELDRILARPSAEHTVDAEAPLLKREDDRGGV